MKVPRKQSELTLSEALLTGLLVVLFGFWTWNLVRLASCDYATYPGNDFRCEFIHGVGLFVPPLAVITAWYDDGV